MLREFNCVGFLCGETGAQMGGWFRNEVRGLSDLSGLKFRIAGMGGQISQRLGAAPALIAGADVYPSLERGVIGAAEWVGPYGDEKLGFQRVARFYTRPASGSPARAGTWWSTSAPGTRCRTPTSTRKRASSADQFQWFRIAENSYDNFAFTVAAR